MAVAELAARHPDPNAIEQLRAEDAGFRFEIELKDGKAPAAFRVFKAGENPSTKGSYNFTEASGAACMAYQSRRVMDTMIDYEHASRYATFAADPQRAGRAAAWCRLELKNGELWATKVDWTAAGREAVESKEQRFFSPVFAYNKDTMEIGECMQLGLTSTPALDGLQPLAAKNDGEKPEQENVNELQKLLAELAKQMALKSDASATDVMLSIAQLKSDGSRMFEALKATSISDALGKIAGLQQNGEQIAALRADIEKQKVDAGKARVATMIEAALTAKKAVPAQRPMLELMGSTDEAMLKSFIDTLQPIPGAAAHTPLATASGALAAGASQSPGLQVSPQMLSANPQLAALTSADLEVARMMGNSGEKSLVALANLRSGGVNVAPLTPKNDK